MNSPEVSGECFYVVGGSLRHDASCYIERPADRELLESVLKSEFCFVLTSRQMGKSSLMVRASSRLRQQGVTTVTLDLTAVGQNLSPEQWYDGLLALAGRQLRLEDELDDYWLKQQRLSPVQRFFSALREIVLTHRTGPIAVFIDEVDTVRSLPFSTDEFFAAIRQCYNCRTDDVQFNRLTFCLLGVATPSELIRDTAKTPFSIGRRIELTDLTKEEARPLVARLGLGTVAENKLLDDLFQWTNGHPYLIQRILQTLAEDRAGGFTNNDSAATSTIDRICERVFLSARARERDDNLLFVREQILRGDGGLSKLLGLYERVHNGEIVPDDESDERIGRLRTAGVVRAVNGHLELRNRIYKTVFNLEWIRAHMPDGEIEKPDGQRVRIDGTCNIGRATSNDVALADQKVSRRHALIQAQKQQEFWLLDLGSSNGTYVNGKRVAQPVLLRDGDQIEIGPFRLVFRQSKAPLWSQNTESRSDQTVCSPGR